MLGWVFNRDTHGLYHTNLLSCFYSTEKCFHVIPSVAEENLDKSDPKYEGENVWKYAVDTARLKAEEVFNRLIQKKTSNETSLMPILKDKFMVIGSDTIVTYKERIYGKPKDKEDAKRTLRELSGETHSVISGVVIISNQTSNHFENKLESSFYAVTEVEFDDLNDSVIQAYVDTGEPSDKAGAYGIQGLGGTLVKQINGDYYNVVGFPLNMFCRNIMNMYK